MRAVVCAIERGREGKEKETAVCYIIHRGGMSVRPCEGAEPKAARTSVTSSTNSTNSTRLMSLMEFMELVELVTLVTLVTLARVRTPPSVESATSRSAWSLTSFVPVLSRAQVRVLGGRSR